MAAAEHGRTRTEGLDATMLARRIDNIPDIEQVVQQWSLHRNQKQTGIDWQFTTEDARVKLKRLYRKLNPDKLLGQRQA
jgi:hypothetical protein